MPSDASWTQSCLDRLNAKLQVPWRAKDQSGLDDLERTFNSGMAVVYKAQGLVIKAVDVAAMEFDTVISLETEDRDGDKIFTDGWELENYQKNPVMTWDHTYSFPPLGRAMWIKKDKPRLVARPRFWDGPGEWGDFSREIFAMYTSEPPNIAGFSVGFIPRMWKFRRGEEDENGWRPILGIDFTESELLEFAAVPIPAHQDALKGVIAAAKKAELHGGKFGGMLHELARRGVRPELAVTDPDMAELEQSIADLWASTTARSLRSRQPPR